MNSEQLFTLFNEIPEDCRMLVIDAAAVGCFLYRDGHHAAGLKLLHTAITTAGLDTEIIQWILENPEKSFKALAMHAEIRALVNHFSG
ncbi:MAG: hypothetical protein WAW41_10205 [Methylobacter sp.]